MNSIFFDDDINYIGLSYFIDNRSDWEDYYKRSVFSGWIDNTYTMDDFIVSEYNDEFRRQENETF